MRSDNFKLVLGSGSPRRKQLLSDLGLEFTVRVSDADESAPSNLSPTETVEWVAKSKAEALIPSLKEDELLITADTEVWQGNHRFGKPDTPEEAKSMLKKLSGTTHQVISGFCICNKSVAHTYHVSTTVYFEELSDDVIDYYIKEYRPFDKAGAYGIQEWIGMIGIQKIEGSYYNVVGLPTADVFAALKSWPHKA